MYKCLVCNKNFQSKKRNKHLKEELLSQYIWQRQTYSDLANQYGKSKKWVQIKLDEVEIKNIVKLKPCPLIVAADTTFFSRQSGLVVFREPNLKKNIWWKEVIHEKTDAYLQERRHLAENGFTIQAVVLDGKRGVRQAFNGIPIQMCHFHQKQIVRRYLTNKPKLKASIELKEIVKTLANTNKQTFSKELNNWHNEWKDFLNEKTINPQMNRWCYTHKRLRSAYRSLKTNLPYLFTYQKYPNLKIPNTTNSLDGYFNRLKSLLNVHRGLSPKRRIKIVIEILKGRK